MIRVYALLLSRGRGVYDWLEFSLDVSALTGIALQRSVTLPHGEYYLIQQLDIDLHGYKINPLLKIDGLGAQRRRTR